MPASRGATIALWIVSILLAALYVFGGVPKVLRNPQFVAEFARIGFPDWFLPLIGVIEVVGGLGLLVPAVAFYAAGLLAIVMVGAVATTAVASPLGPAILMPILCLALLVWIASVRRPQAAGLPARAR